MATKAAKGKKKKGQTMALTDFLSDEQGPSSGTSYVMANKMDWAAEMEEADANIEPVYQSSAVERIKLPTAPKASRGSDVDMSRIPVDPPYLAFIGNLPYEVSPEKIETFFGNLPVVKVRLPEDNGRFRGFGYVEFENRQGLIDALALNDETLGGRKVRVDLAGQDKGEKGGRGGRDDGGPDRTDSDWRRKEPGSSDSFNDDRRGGDRYGDRDGDRSSGFDRRDGYDRRDGGYERRDGYDRRDNYQQRDGGGRDSYDRRDDRYNYGSRDDRRGGYGDDRRGGYGDDRRGGGGYGRDRYDDRRGGGYDDRDGRRGFGSGYRRDDRGGDSYGDRRGGDRYGDRDGDRSSGFDRRDGYDRRDGGYERRDGYDRRDNYERRDNYQQRDGGGRDGYDRRDDRYNYGRQDRTSRDSSHETPKERPRLQLQPRTKPVEKTVTGEEKKPSSSIFGSAKPVDTAQREREIEERLMQQKLSQSSGRDSRDRDSRESRGYGDSRESSRGYGDSRESSRGYGDSRESRDYHGSQRYEEDKENRPSTEKSHRRMSDSDKSQDGDRRERHLSSGSNKGRKGPTVTTSRSRRDSDQSSHSNEVFSGGEEHKDEPYSPQAPVTTPGKDENAVKLVPAPPPSVNIWEKRKTQQTSPSQKQEESPSHPATRTSPAHGTGSQSREPPVSQSDDMDSSQSTRESQNQSASKPPSQSSKSRLSQNEPQKSQSEAKKDFVPAEPPKENPWMKRKQERDQHLGASKSDTGAPLPNNNPPPVANAWAGRGGGDRGRGRGGRGAGGGFGRGRGASTTPQKREKPLPQSLDEMPKYEENKAKDFSDSNKFAGLLEDDDFDAEDNS